MHQRSPRESHAVDKLLFVLVCVYWLSQAFLVPLAPIGLSWAVWPALSDLVVFVMLPVVLYRLPRRIYDYDTRAVLKFALGAFSLCAASFLIATIFYGTNDSLIVIGAYQVCRSMQYLVVLVATAQMTMSLFRWTTFRWVTLTTFCLICSGVLLTFSGLISTSQVTPLIPSTAVVSGPWGPYAGGAGDAGCGFISYNHGYTGMQLILSGSVAYLFFEQCKHIRLVICFLLLFCTFVSGCRTAFVISLMLVLALEWKRAKSNLLALIFLCGLCGMWVAARSYAVDGIVERQASSVSSMEDDGLSGRTDIWHDHLEYFGAHPLSILFGTGYGYAGKVSSTNSHDLYLHIMTETGLPGLFLFLCLQRRTLFLLRSRKSKPMRFGVWALLASGLLGETLYPVASFSQFLGLYLSALTIAIRFVANSEGRPVSLTQYSTVGSACEA